MDRRAHRLHTLRDKLGGANISVRAAQEALTQARHTRDAISATVAETGHLHQDPRTVTAVALDTAATLLKITLTHPTAPTGPAAAILTAAHHCPMPSPGFRALPPSDPCTTATPPAAAATLPNVPGPLPSSLSHSIPHLPLSYYRCYTDPDLSPSVSKMLSPSVPLMYVLTTLQPYNHPPGPPVRLLAVAFQEDITHFMTALQDSYPSGAPRQFTAWGPRAAVPTARGDTALPPPTPPTTTPTACATEARSRPTLILPAESPGNQRKDSGKQPV